MIKDIFKQNAKKIMAFLLIISLLSNAIQYKKNQHLQKDYEICKKKNNYNDSRIYELENEKQELEDEKEEIEYKLEERQ